MTIKELKKQIQDLPDDMPVVYSHDDNPDLANCDKIEIVTARLYNNYGYEYANTFGKDLIPPIKVAIINA